MKTIGWAGLLLSMLCAFGCASTYGHREQTAVSAAIAVLIVGAAVHGQGKDEKRLQEDASQPDK